MFDLIVSQGRIADRSNGTIRGAKLTAQALKSRYGAKEQSIGKPSAPVMDDWRESLSQAKDTLTRLQDAISISVKKGNFPVMVANTCSASLASLPVVAREHPEAMVLWIDAHGDFNTPKTTGTGYLGGMVVAAACGLWDSGHGAGLRPHQVIVVGARDIDRQENALLKKTGVQIIRPDEVTPQRILDAIGDAPVWIHVDWDVLEPGFIPADYKIADGLAPEQIRKVIEAITPERILGLELAEFQAQTSDRSNEKALSLILDTVAPAFATRR